MTLRQNIPLFVISGSLTRLKSDVIILSQLVVVLLFLTLRSSDWASHFLPSILSLIHGLVLLSEFSLVFLNIFFTILVVWSLSLLKFFEEFLLVARNF